MSNTFVEIHNLKKHYKSVTAVDGISFELRRGEVVGFVGANGSGKTTTMRMMVGLEIPDAGQITIDGREILKNGSDLVRKIGWMPDSYGSYKDISVWEYLDFFARAYGLKGKHREERLRSVMEFTELNSLADKDTDSLSKGMKQRLCLGRTLIFDPDLLILDEPAAGLDPKARLDFKHLIRILASEGKTVLISSHILSELENMCDTFLFIDRGIIIHDGDTSTIKRTTIESVEVNIHIVGPLESFHEWCVMQQGVSLVEKLPTGFRLSLIRDDSSTGSTEEVQRAEFLKSVFKAGFSVSEYSLHERNLEDAFVDLVTKRNSITNKKSTHNGTLHHEESKI
jgi:ABC-2 type transport system ATP-binding protein